VESLNPRAWGARNSGASRLCTRKADIRKRDEADEEPQHLSSAPSSPPTKGSIDTIRLHPLPHHTAALTQPARRSRQPVAIGLTHRQLDVAHRKYRTPAGLRPREGSYRQFFITDLDYDDPTNLPTNDAESTTPKSYCSLRQAHAHRERARRRRRSVTARVRSAAVICRPVICSALLPSVPCPRIRPLSPHRMLRSSPLARIMHDVEIFLRRLWRKAADSRSKSLFQRVASRINPAPQRP
jgi:hypothetical protein